jgi:hypothetical protein
VSAAMSLIRCWKEIHTACCVVGQTKPAQMLQAGPLLQTVNTHAASLARTVLAVSMQTASPPSLDHLCILHLLLRGPLMPTKFGYMYRYLHLGLLCAQEEGGSLRASLGTTQGTQDLAAGYSSQEEQEEGPLGGLGSVEQLPGGGGGRWGRGSLRHTPGEGLGSHGRLCPCTVTGDMSLYTLQAASQYACGEHWLCAVCLTRPCSIDACMV